MNNKIFWIQQRKVTRFCLKPDNLPKRAKKIISARSPFFKQSFMLKGNSNQPGSRNRQCCQSPRQGTARPLPYQEIFRAGHMILQNPSNLMVTEGTDMSSSRTKGKRGFSVGDSNYDMTSNLVTHFTPTHTALKRVGCARV